MPSYPLANFEIQKHYQNEPRFNGVYSRDNLPKLEDEGYVINLNDYTDTGSHWVALYLQNKGVTYFHSFGVEHIPKEIKTFVGDKNVKTYSKSISGIQAYDSIMCVCFCIGFIGFMFNTNELVSI